MLSGGRVGWVHVNWGHGAAERAGEEHAGGDGDGGVQEGCVGLASPPHALLLLFLSPFCAPDVICWDILQSDRSPWDTPLFHHAGSE